MVSVADDGGSSGRLRRDLDVPAPGDLRRCLVALARDEVRGRRRSSTGSGRASSPTTRSATSCSSGSRRRSATSPRARRGRPPPRRGRPGAARDARTGVDDGRVGGDAVTGQVAIAEPRGSGRIRDVAARPGRPARVPRRARGDRAAPTRSCSRPGSLYTSIVPCWACPRSAAALAAAPRRRWSRSRTSPPEPRRRVTTAPTICGGARTRRPGRPVPLRPRPRLRGRRRQRSAALGVEPVAADVARRERAGARPGNRLAKALSALL